MSAEERRQVREQRALDVEREWIKALERVNRELRQSNEILRENAVLFAQAELDRPRECWWP